MYKGHNSLISADMLNVGFEKPHYLLLSPPTFIMFLPEGSCQVMALDIIYIISIVIEPIKYSCDSYNKPVNLLAEHSKVIPDLYRCIRICTVSSPNPVEHVSGFSGVSSRWRIGTAALRRVASGLDFGVRGRVDSCIFVLLADTTAYGGMLPKNQAPDFFHNWKR